MDLGVAIANEFVEVKSPVDEHAWAEVRVRDHVEVYFEWGNLIKLSLESRIRSDQDCCSAEKVGKAEPVGDKSRRDTGPKILVLKLNAVVSDDEITAIFEPGHGDLKLV